MASRPAKKSAAKKFTAEQLLEKAEEFFFTGHPETAEKFYKRAVEQAPENADVLDAYGSFLLEIDRFDEAKQVFARSIELAPQADAGKYMNMGQLTEGLEATKYYGRGIEIMERQLSLLQPQKPSKAKKEETMMLRQQIAAAYTSIAEIYLTDACFEDQAESECERVLGAAISYDPDNPEPLQAFASVRMSQQRPAEALELMNRSYSKWRDLEHDDQPSLEFRHNAAKLLLEMGQHEPASEIWEAIIEEDDSIAEVYYFLGLAYQPTSPTDCLDCAQKAQQLLVASRCEDELLQQQVAELLAAAQAAVAALPPAADDEPSADGDEAEENEPEQMDE